MQKHFSFSSYLRVGQKKIIILSPQDVGVRLHLAWQGKRAFEAVRFFYTLLTQPVKTLLWSLQGQNSSRQDLYGPILLNYFHEEITRGAFSKHRSISVPRSIGYFWGKGSTTPAPAWSCAKGSPLRRCEVPPFSSVDLHLARHSRGIFESN